MKSHVYKSTVEWTGNKGSGTFDYRSYSRDHVISGVDKRSTILGSSDPSFRGDNLRYNPEELFVSSISSCHMLWFLHLCAVNDVIVLEYTDTASGEMIENTDGSGKFKQVSLHPQVTVAKDIMLTKINDLHKEAHKMCFIANSCNFQITVNPISLVK